MLRASMHGSHLVRISDGRTDLVFEWIADGGAPNATDDGGVSLLAWCAYYGDVSAMRFLLSQGETLETLGPNYDLNGAAFHGHWRLCQFLLENGADANVALDDTGETPLHAALSKADRPAYVHVVRILLADGADPNAATKPNVETGAFMRDVRAKGETPLHRAAAYASGEAIDLLLDAGAQKDALDAHGDSPLSWASWHLRPRSILARLCFGPHTIHPDASSDPSGERHVASGTAMETHLLGRPHFDPSS